MKLFRFIALFFPILVCGQVRIFVSDSAPEPIIYDNSEYQNNSCWGITRSFAPTPDYHGGEDGMMKFIKDNFEIPAYERENNIQGRIIVSFIIDEKGEVTDAEIKKGLSVGLNKEVLRVVRLLRFKPEMANGKPMKFNYTLPILVSYEETKSKKRSR